MPKTATKKKAIKNPVRKQPVRKVTARRKKTTRVAKVRPEPIVSTVAPVTTVQAPILQTGYKDIAPARENRAKLWLAVSLCTFLVVCLWAYMLSQRLLNSTAIEDSLAATNVDEFMNSINGDLSELQTSTDQFVNTTGTTTNLKQADAPDNEQLDNLFSDLQ